MTLVEMLVALTASLIMMAAIAQIFSAFGSAINTSRSVLDIDAQMRSVAWRLRSDLAGATARMLPPLSPEGGEGYFEAIEGPRTDADASDGTTVGPADHDDVLLFTTRSADAPFTAVTRTAVSSGPVGTLESNVAEVAWFARPTPGASNPATYTLYRRQLLVLGYVGSGTFAANNTNSIPFSSWTTFYDTTGDLSVRREGNLLYPNTLSDLTRRESRFMHQRTTTGVFPYFFPDADRNVTHQNVSGTSGLFFDSTSPRQGEDTVLTNVIAFDVRVFDPAAPVTTGSNGTPLVPGDPGFVSDPVASGAYVDLGNGVMSNFLLSASRIYPRFSGFGQLASGLVGSGTTRRTYDTWSTHYEANGRDDDNDSVIDEGTDGKDSDQFAPDGQIDEPAYDANGDGDYDDPGDDAGEMETSPPYPYPLRGIEVRIRCYEPSSRQVRQVTVRQTFVPQ
jgi:hypothetical protein